MPISLVTLDGITARKPDGGTLFEHLDLAFGRERTALVGRNGSGKTTLLQIAAGLRPPSEGKVTRHGRVGLMQQNLAVGDGMTVVQILGVAEPLAAQARILAGEGTGDDLSAADWTLESRIAETLAEVGLPAMDLARPAASLSGTVADRRARRSAAR